MNQMKQFTTKQEDIYREEWLAELYSLLSLIDSLPKKYDFIDRDLLILEVIDNVKEKASDELNLN